jgi:group II intron reverse transcriptase/maturase
MEGIETKSKSQPITKQMVWEAWKKVKTKGKSAGIDQISIADFEKELAKNLYKIWNRLASGSYFPPPVREVEIPKKDGKVRKLGIPTVGDRVAQTVVKDYVEPEIDKLFDENSYGYRPHKSAHQALERVKTNCSEYSWVIDLDIKGFFDNIDHRLLMKAVERHIKEKWVLMYIKRWLEMPIQLATGEIKQKEGKGTPQGGVISPLLANLFLHYAFDVWIRRTFTKVEFARYADDVIIHCQTKKQAEYILDKTRKRMRECLLELHPLKTKLVYCKDYKRKEEYENVQFNFLGYSFQPRTTISKVDKKPFLKFDLGISRESRKKIGEDIIKLNIDRSTNQTIEEIADKLNPKLQGWINYYGKFRRYEMNKIFRRLNKRLVKWIQNRYKHLRGKLQKAYGRLTEIYKSNPTLFAHWKLGSMQH